MNEIKTKHYVWTYLVIAIVHFLGHLLPELYYNSLLQYTLRGTLFFGGFLLFVGLIIKSYRTPSDNDVKYILLGILLVIVAIILDFVGWLYFEFMN
ncbi:MAG: hypothetical protein ACJAUD_001492 [Crocinitomicaceae bacterium]|jgi:hypothetical protein